MNISYNWLKRYVGFDLTPEQVSAALTSIGLETGSVEEVQTIKGGLEGLVIGKVMTCIDHPNSDHLHITTVDLGDGNSPTQIVCGAANVAAGLKVVVATVGATLYSGEESFKIKRSKIRGEESNGMICAEDEIGIGTSHDGIIELPADAQVGMPASEYYGVKSDYVLEVDITPNRVDAASHFGVARDLAAYLTQNCGSIVAAEKPSVEAFASNEKASFVSVRVENAEACPRYSGVTINGVTVKESPKWLQDSLRTIGVRPINNIVDVTNFVLHEMGHPLHCFDRAEIKGDEVVVRCCAEGTAFVTLDEKERKLAASDLMICNAEEPMCLAGVFGGLHSGVTEKSTSVFLESAYFHPSWVRKSARRHQLNTDSSFRFERGCDPDATFYVLKRAALLIQELAGGEIAGPVQDVVADKELLQPYAVELSLNKVTRLIGKYISEAEVSSILKSLDITVVKRVDDDGDVCLQLNVPRYRVDVQRDVDVIEDILRIYGYNNVEIPERVNATLSYKKEADSSYKIQNTVSEQLVGAGFAEIMNNSLTKISYYETNDLYPVSQCVKLLNPLSADLSVMRQTLLFGGLESISYNRNRKMGDLRLFEFGNIYAFNAEAAAGEQPLKGYAESFRLGMWLSGNLIADSWAHILEKSSVYQLKAMVENVMSRLGVLPEGGKGKTETFSNSHFRAGMNYLTQGGKVIATLGVVSKSLLKQMDIDTEVFYAEMNWDVLMREYRKTKIRYEELSKFPGVKRDLALLLDGGVTFEQIEKVAYATERKLLKEVFLFDVYEGKNLEEGKKSYAVSFVLADKEKTLTDKQIEITMERIRAAIEKELGARLR